MLLLLYLLFLFPTFVASDDISLDNLYPTTIHPLEALKANDSIKVCTDNSILSLTVVSTQDKPELSNFMLYDAKNMSNLIGNLGSLKFPVMSQSGCFVLWCQDNNTADGDSMAFFTNLEIQSQHCQGPNYFLDSDSDSSKLYSIASTTSGPCEMILIASFNYSPYRLWFSDFKSNASILTFKSAVNNQFLFNITAHDLPYWRNLGIYTKAMSITIPPGSNLTMTLASNSITETRTLEFDGEYQRGIMASPSYCGENEGWVDYYFVIKSNHSIPGNFYVRELSVVTDDSYLMYSDSMAINGEYIILKYQQNLTIDITNFYILFKTPADNPNNLFVMEYQIGILPTPELTTIALETTLTSESSTTEYQMTTTSIITSTTEEPSASMAIVDALRLQLLIILILYLC